jgi:hypothetical protein
VVANLRWLIPLPAIVLAFWPIVVSASEVPPNPYYNAPQNLTTEPAANNGITVKWDVPEVSNYDRIDIYVIEFYKLTNGVESGGWAVWTDAENHAYTLGSWIYNYTGENARFKVKAGSDACVGRPDPIGYCLYGEKGSVDAVINNPATTTTSSTTTSSSTTSTSTTTTTTTSSSTTTTSSTTTLPEETTTTTEPVQISTTTSTVDTTTSTTTTTEPPYTPTQTSSTIPEEEPEQEEEEFEEELEEELEEITTTTETQPEPTTTSTETTIDEPETTEPETSTTVPDDLPEDTVEPAETTIPETTVPDDEVQIVPDETEQPTDTTQPQEYISETTLLKVENSSTTTLPETVIDIPANEPVTDEQIEQILETLSEAAPAQILSAIQQVLTADITSDQATQIASSPEVLAAITETQAEQLFEQIEVEELTDTQLETFTEAIQEAPTKIKEAFEKTIDIFGSQFDNYTPTGSNIPVKERRTIVAIGALIAAIPPTRIRR